MPTSELVEQLGELRWAPCITSPPGHTKYARVVCKVNPSLQGTCMSSCTLELNAAQIELRGWSSWLPFQSYPWSALPINVCLVQASPAFCSSCSCFDAFCWTHRDAQRTMPASFTAAAFAEVERASDDPDAEVRLFSPDSLASLLTRARP